jgi:hypothetical protein
MTVPELAKLYRMGEDKLRGLIRSGQLGAINTASAKCRNPRYVILPHHREEFEEGRKAGPPPKKLRRTRDPGLVDYLAHIKD